MQGNRINNFILLAFLFIGLTIPSTIQKKCAPGDSDCHQWMVGLIEEGKTSCKRECDGKPKTCYYELHVEPYSAMGPACGECPRNRTACFDPQCVTADGVERGLFVYNRQLPGPLIEVCKGDHIVVDVINGDGHRSTSVHWHGIRQIGTPHSDGVPMITQCPINPGQTFRYQFKAIDAGSFFYHSHSGVQKIDGLGGPFVVRDEKANEVFGHLYDHDLSEHVIYIQDWMHVLADVKVPGVTRGPHSRSMPQSYLINGKGIYVGSTEDPKHLLSQVNSPSQTPISEFIVEQGKRYRFRIIGSTCLACTVKFSIQGHRMTVIHTDGGGPVIPEEVDTISLNSGDRFDVIIEANNKADSYWILTKGQGPCPDALQVALLKYAGASPTPSSNLPLEVPQGITLNPTNPKCSLERDLCVSELSSPLKVPDYIRNKVPNIRLVFKFGFHFYSKSELFQSGTYNAFFEPSEPLLVRAQVNAITNKPYSSPLLSQYHEIPSNAFCSKECQEKHLDCVCLNIYKVPLHSVVDMIIVDTASYIEGGLTHPFHLHGHNFYVLKEGTFKGDITKGIEEIYRWLDEGGAMNNTNNVLKDSIGIPSGGFAVVRMVADNPGFWIFHCHFTLHLDLGMSAILQVGELHDMAKVPKGFPQCCNYVPPVKH